MSPCSNATRDGIDAKVTVEQGSPSEVPLAATGIRQPAAVGTGESVGLFPDFRLRLIVIDDPLVPTHEREQEQQSVTD
jgi:hypothetical protein